MSRGFSDCCHYDDGYDEGYEDGKLESGLKAELIADVIRVMAQNRRMAGDFEASRLLEEVADEAQHDPWLERHLEDGPKRAARIAEMYAEARRAVAA